MSPPPVAHASLALSGVSPSMIRYPGCPAVLRSLVMIVSALACLAAGVAYAGIVVGGT